MGKSKLVKGSKKVTSISCDKDKEVILANEIIENCRYGLSNDGFKLLMAFISCIDFTNSIWPEFSFDIRGLFKFFGLSENNGKRYDIVQNALDNIGANPLQYKKTKRKWDKIYWLSRHSFDGSEGYQLTVKFNPDVMPYLMSFKYDLRKAIGKKAAGYSSIFAENYFNFTCKYSPWMYPWFKKWEDKVTFEEVQITKEMTWVREKTYTEKAYPVTSDFLKRVVNPLIKDVNEVSDIYVKPISSKNDNLTSEIKGNKHTHIIFMVKPKKIVTLKEAPELVKKKSPHTKPRTEEDLRERYSVVIPITYESLYASMSSEGLEATQLAKKRNMIYHRISGDPTDKHFFCKKE